MKLIKRVVLILFLTASILLPSTALTARMVAAEPCEPQQSILGLPTWYKYLEGELSGGKCTPTIENTNAALPIGIALLEGALRLSGIVAVVMIFWGSFKFITSAGNSDSAAGARKTIINALIGLVIVIVSTGVVSYLGNTLG